MLPDIFILVNKDFHKFLHRLTLFIATGSQNKERSGKAKLKR